jgi:hypothetical protein
VKDKDKEREWERERQQEKERQKYQSERKKIAKGRVLLLGSLWLSNHWSFKVNQLIRMIT